jgi:hypothetical protein
MFFETAAYCCVSELVRIATTPRHLEELLRRPAQVASSSTDLRVRLDALVANAATEPQAGERPIKSTGVIA